MTKKEQLYQKWLDDKNINIINECNQIGLDRRAGFRYVAQFKSGLVPGMNQKPIGGREGIKREFTENTGTIEVFSFSIRTLDEALEVARVDLEKWRVDRYIVNSWEVTMKLRQESGTGDGGKPIFEDQPETRTNYQVKVWLKPKTPQPLEVAIRNLVKKLPKYKPAKVKKIGDPTGDYLLEISLNDVHWGLHAWRMETGDDWDLKITDAFYKIAVEKLLGLTQRYDRIAKILFPIGQDFYHINNPKNTTPRNSNQLDVDNRMAKIFEVAKMAVIKAIDFCLGIAPVHILYIPGNHDPETSYYLLEVLHAWYRNTDDVFVDTSPKSRKFFEWGQCMIGFTHGIDEAERDLPAIMMGQEPQMFGRTKYREIHIGHLHKKREVRWVSTDTYVGTVVRMLPSLCGTDKWHFDKGYVNKLQAGEAYLWDKENGNVGYFTVNLK